MTLKVNRVVRGNGLNHNVPTFTSKVKWQKRKQMMNTHMVMHGIFYSQSKLRLNISQLALLSHSHKLKQALMESEWAEGEAQTSWWWTFPSIRVSPLRRAFKTLLHYITRESKRLRLTTGCKARKPLEENLADEIERKLLCTSAGQNLVKSSAAPTRASCQCPQWWCKRWAALHGGTSASSTQNLLQHALDLSKCCLFWIVVVKSNSTLFWYHPEHSSSNSPQFNTNFYRQHLNFL